MLASVKEEHSSPTHINTSTINQQQMNGQQVVAPSSIMSSSSAMNKEEVHSSTTMNNTMMNQSISPNVIPPNYQQQSGGSTPSNNIMDNQHGGYYPPMHHHQHNYYGSYGGHHYPPSQMNNNTLPSISSSTPYGTTESYAPNPPTIQHQGIQQPPYGNMDNVQQQSNNNQGMGQQQSMYQQAQLSSNVPPSQNSNNSSTSTSNLQSGVAPPSAQNSSSSSQQQQQTVTHTIFHEYQTHKKSGSPINDANSGEYHPIACIPCRKRHKKCDRLLPKCSECGKRGIDCQYYEPKQKGRKKKDDLPNSSEYSPQPSSPTNTPTDVSQQYGTPQTPTYNSNNFQQVPSFNQQMQNITPENSPVGFQTRERSASYQKYRSEPYPSVNRHDLSLYNNSNGINSAPNGTSVTPQRERAVSSASSSNYYNSSSPYYNSQQQQPPINNNGPLSVKTTPVHNQYLQSSRAIVSSSSSPDSSNDTNLPSYAKFVPIEKEKLKEQLYIRRVEFEGWDTFRISQWIDTLDASFTSHNVGELFKHHDIDGLAFLGLHNQILLEMGIAKVGVRLRLVRIIDHLRSQN